MNRTSRIVGGIAILGFGIVWALETMGLIHINLDGWWTVFIIAPCLAAFLSSKHKSVPLIGFGIGILLLLATLQIVQWGDIWKYIICLVAVVWGVSLIFGKSCMHGMADLKTVSEMKHTDLDGRQICQIDTSFSKQLYEFGGKRFEGAKVRTSFGFVALDLRNADVLDGAVIDVECSFGGMEIRVDKELCVKPTVTTSFGGVECHCNTQTAANAKTLYIKGTCGFGGIEIK